MPFAATVIQVLIASPSDLAEERKAAAEAVYEWNAQHAAAESVVLLPVAWETHATPRSGVRPQEAINQQLVDQSDVLVGMFWTKLGTSTGLAASGTVEEIDRFIAASKPAQLYFSSRPIDPGKIDQKQHKNLKAFKETTYKNALVGSFDSLDSLRQNISRNLLSEVRSLKLKNARGGASLAPVAASATSPKEPHDEDEPSLTPDESWDRDKFERAIYFAVHKADEVEYSLGILGSLFDPANSAGTVGMAALPVPKNKYSISYFGQIRGRAVIGEVKRERTGDTLLTSAGEQKMSMIFNDAGDEISVFEEANSKELSVHVLKRVQLVGAPSRS